MHEKLHIRRSQLDAKIRPSVAAILHGIYHTSCKLLDFVPESDGWNFPSGHRGEASDFHCRRNEPVVKATFGKIRNGRWETTLFICQHKCGRRCLKSSHLHIFYRVSFGIFAMMYVLLFKKLEDLWVKSSLKLKIYILNFEIEFHKGRSCENIIRK